MSKRIGIMGGTFDPIHFGHLVTAEAAWQQFELDQVVFVPSGNPPHKVSRVISSAEHRLTMTLMATVSNPHFSVSRVEIDRSGFSYAYDTVCAFAELYGADAELFFITGADALLEIADWVKAEQLIEKCRFIGATRPGWDIGDFAKMPQRFRERAVLMQVPALAISSSDIRARVKNGQTIRYLLPETVEKYIEKQGLYL
ncbi:MAG: nicotinate-nucleotide adenylyltransferase [Firmicutes bacterium]|nr:nicotinate-nucleotide adenylyltransferase [Bacillota bacterium]MBQ3111613.1 nicotinate-nucleotide adenylyltransferase [Bacillota bacterium]MBQ6842275.1 nicotinate-nucleotide adenylyltransferase [Bacillota bacterium]MBR7113457.1 nicotinate-nucleotide adenylyltransferase [Bacillota bacterium]